MLIYILIFIVFPCAFFYKSHIRKEEYILKEVLNKNDTSVLRGFAAIAIMFAHYVVHSMDETDSFGGPIAVMKWAGGLGVCIFFFCSGYGLFLSIDDKKIERGFLWKRFKRILPTYWILRLIFAILLKKIGNSVLYFVLYVLGIREQAWFVTEILLVYILFYISARISRKYLIPVMTAMLTAMSLLFFFMDLEAMWYNANLLFVLGMLFACYKSKLIKWLNNNYWLKLMATVCLFGILAGIFIVTKGTAVSNFFKLPAGGLVSIILVQLLIKIKPESPIMIFIGKYSLELYIIHLSVWQVYSKLIVNSNIQFKFLICVVISLLGTWVCCLAKQLIKYMRKQFVDLI